MASFLTGKLARQKNGRFTKPLFSKKAKNFANKHAHSENMAILFFSIDGGRARQVQ